jgi:hypothetical protein
MINRFHKIPTIWVSSKLEFDICCKEISHCALGGDMPRRLRQLLNRTLISVVNSAGVDCGQGSASNSSIQKCLIKFYGSPEMSKQYEHEHEYSQTYSTSVIKLMFDKKNIIK